MVDNRVKLKESKRRDKYLELSRELKKLGNIKVTVVPIIIGTLGTVIRGLVQGEEDLEKSVIKIGQYSEESPGDMGRLAVTQTLEINY